MLPELLTLREVQAFDMRIAAYDRELARVPATLQRIDDEISAAQSRVREVEGAIKETGAERRRAETELEEAEANIEKYNDQLLGARSNEEYKGLQQQIDNTKTRIGTIEDRILALMEKSDELEAKLGNHQRTFRERNTELEAEKTDVRARAQEQEDQRSRLLERRTAAFAGLSQEVAHRYERIRSARNGLAVAPVRDDRCSACNVRLRPQLFEELQMGVSILACEACARLLVFEPETAAGSSS